MKQILFTILSILGTCFFADAQNFKWGTQNGNTQPFYDILEVNGSIYATGYGTLLSKCDANGKLVWTKSITQYLNGQFMSRDGFGSIYVAGAFNGNLTVKTKSGSVTLATNVGDMFLAKLDTAGNVIWIKQSQSNDGASTRAMTVDKKGNVFLSGVFEDKITIGSANLASLGLSDAFLTAYDTSGKVRWCKLAGGTQDDNINNLLLTPNGNLIISGTYSNDLKYDSKPAPTTTSFTGLLAEVNPATGSLNWIKGDSKLFYHHLFVIHGGAGIFSNVSFKGSLAAGGQTITSSNPYGYALLTLDTGFNPKSVTKTYLSPDYIVCDDNATVTMAGSFYDSIRIDNSIKYNSLGESDIYMLSYDVKGNLVYSLHTGGGNIDIISEMRFSEDNNYIYISGSVQSGPAKFGSVSIPGDFSGAGFILKMDAPFAGILEEKINNRIGLTIYPNPTQKSAYVKLNITDESLAEQLLRVEIYSLQGRLVKSYILRYDGNNDLDIHTLGSGMYLLRVSGGNFWKCVKLEVN